MKKKFAMQMITFNNKIKLEKNLIYDILDIYIYMQRKEVVTKIILKES